MASLEAALAQKEKSLAAARQVTQSKKVRLVADPAISVNSLSMVFRQFLEFRKTDDLWSLVSPPPAGPLSFHWGTPVCGAWLTKVAGLLFDLPSIAPNSKLQSTKVLKALKALVDQKTLTIAVKGRLEPKTEQDALDRIDIAVRLLLSHCRQLKANDSLRAKVYRELVLSDQLKLDMCLDKLVLPPELTSGLCIVEEEDADLKTPEQQVVDESCLAMVPYSSPKPKDAELQLRL